MNIHINNIHIAVVKQPESMPIEAVQTHAVQPSEFKKTPHVEVELMVLFDAEADNYDRTAFRTFYFAVNDIGGQEIAKASSGYCKYHDKRNYYIFGHHGGKCTVFVWDSNVTFPKIKIYKPGVYKYTILQTSKSDKRWLCDESQFPVRAFQSKVKREKKETGLLKAKKGLHSKQAVCAAFFGGSAPKPPEFIAFVFLTEYLRQSPCQMALLTQIERSADSGRLTPAPP